MSDRKLRHTFSAVAWVFTVLCALALLSTAVAVAEHNPSLISKTAQP